MNIYIGHKGYRHFFLELEEVIDPENNLIVDNWDDFSADDTAWLKLNDEQIAFKNENPEASAKEVWDMAITPKPEPTPVPEQDELEVARRSKLSEIFAKDMESNKFFVSVVKGGVEVQNQELWIDKDLRNSLYSITLPALKEDGEVNTKLWTTDVPPVGIEVPIDWAMEKLPLLEIYAKRTYDKRAENEARVYASETPEEVYAINVDDGYPLYLTFELNLDL